MDKQAYELREAICRVAALAAALRDIVSNRLEPGEETLKISYLAAVAEDYADQGLALADRFINHLSRVSSI